jgi:organic radical activating enzyme
MPKGEVSQEVEAVVQRIDDFKSYQELPLVSTGCDSYASWDPRFKHLSPLMTVDGIADRIMEILPFGQWEEEHLVITGGEPLLGWQRAYPALLDHPKMFALKELTFETNGTQELTPDFYEYLSKWAGDRGYNALTFSVSAKLSCSGESREEAIKPDVVMQYESVGYTYLKWVVATEEDAEEALATTAIYRKAGFQGPVYLMPVGGVESVYVMNNRRVADLAMKNGLRYSDRLQVPLFKNEWGT